MQCCDSEPENANLSCTLEHYSQRSDLFPNFNFMITARPICIAMTVINAYLFIVTATYVLRKSRRKNMPWAVLTIPLSHMVSFLYTIRSLVDLYSPNIGIVRCEVIQWMGCTLYGISSSHVYTILWSRQRTLYADPLLRRTVTKLRRILSKVTIVAIYVSFWTVSIVFQFSYCTVSSSVGCIVVWNFDSNALVVVVISIFAVTSAVFHTLLLYLIVHPLIDDDQQGVACRSAIGRLWKPARNDVERMLKRLFFCASLCIVSTQIMSVTMLLNALYVIRTYYVIFVQVDLIVSNVSAVCALSDWKQWLFPFTRLRPVYEGTNQHELFNLSSRS